MISEGKKTEVLRQKPVPVSFFPLPIPHGLPWDETQAIRVKSCLINSLATYTTDLIIYLTFSYKASVPTVHGLLDTACLYCYEQTGFAGRLMKRYLL
jgi:hypothetical protein